MRAPPTAARTRSWPGRSSIRLPGGSSLPSAWTPTSSTSTPPSTSGPPRRTRPTSGPTRAAGTRPTSSPTSSPSLPFRPEFEDLGRDAELAAGVIDRHLAGLGARIDVVELLPPVFYRGKGAYVVGRIRSGGLTVPLLLRLPPRGSGHRARCGADAPPARSASSFRFTRSYFHVDADRPHAIVAFLRSILPHKPVDELYSAIGQNKHAKSLLYRDHHPAPRRPPTRGSRWRPARRAWSWPSSRFLR